jgi:hypothetical protein
MRSNGPNILPLAAIAAEELSSHAQRVHIGGRRDEDGSGWFTANQLLKHRILARGTVERRLAVQLPDARPAGAAIRLA